MSLLNRYRLDRVDKKVINNLIDLEPPNEKWLKNKSFVFQMDIWYVFNSNFVSRRKYFHSVNKTENNNSDNEKQKNRIASKLLSHTKQIIKVK